MHSLKMIFPGLFSRVSLQLIRFFRIITVHCETMTPLVRAMTLFGHGGAWRKNFGLPGRGSSSSSFIVCRKDYSGSRVIPQVKKRAAKKGTLQGIENRNSAINSPQTCGRRETQSAAGQPAFWRPSFFAPSSKGSDPHLKCELDNHEKVHGILTQESYDDYLEQLLGQIDCDRIEW